jgi:hypothetical protein
VGPAWQREDAIVRVGNDAGRFVVGVNALPRGNRSGDEDGD